MRGRTVLETTILILVLASLETMFLGDVTARTNEIRKNLLNQSGLPMEKEDITLLRSLQGSAKILVDPNDNVFYSWEKRINDSIVINVTGANITGLFGLSFKLYFDSSLITCTSLTENLFHTVTPQSSWDNIWQIIKKIDNANGYVEYAYTYMDINRALSEGYAPINITMPAYPEGKLAAATLTFSITKMPPPNDYVDCTLHLTAVQPTDVSENIISYDLIDGYYRLTSPTGDINDDKMIDIYDAILFAKTFGSIPSSSNWNPKADLNSDDTVDIFDALILASNFGKATV